MTGISRTMACHASLFVALLLALQSPSVSAFQPRLSPPPQAPSHHSTRREFVKTRLFQSTKTDGEQSTAASTSATSSSWKPTIQSLSDRKTYFRQQREQSSLLSSDSQMERLGTLGFHHMEFYTGDALMTAKRFELALGMPITCWSSLATGNDVCVTYGLECGVKYDGEGRVVDVESGEGVRFLVTAPLSRALNRQRRNENGTKSDERNSGSGSGGQASSQVQMTAPLPLPGYDVEAAHEFYSQHGLGVRAVGIEVRDATSAYENAVANGAIGVLEPTIVPSFYDDKSGKECHMAEVKLYGDVVLRLVSFHSLESVNDNSESSNNDNSQTWGSSPPKPFLPHLAPYPSHNPNKPTYGLTRLDHTVGNVPDLLATQNYIQSFTNYHPFAEFTPEDVGTVDSGLNSVVLASDNEAVLLPLNEPTEGKRKSQIQTFLEQNEGPGLQHIAIKTNDIFSTIEQMRHAEENFGGFELMKRPSEGYYRELPERLGDKLTEEQYERLEELGILADADDEGVLLQIFTKPLGDRPTVFIEIIQRIGCVLDQGNGMSGNDAGKEKKVKERPGCGGFGQGNFRELFKAIEDHEKTLKV